MTGSAKQSPQARLSSPGLTGRSSTPRPSGLFQTSLEYWIARSSRAMTAVFVRTVRRCRLPIQLSNSEHASAFSRHDLPELCSKLGPPEARGRREDRVHAAPAVSCANMCKENAHEHTGSAEAIRPSLRNGLTAYNALSPENRALLSPSPADNSAGLTPTTEASGPHDFAVRDLQRSSAAAIASTASHRTFVTIASRPSHRVRRGKLIKLICPTC
jgi:hypothetical protein